jgi:hypothetical protein
VKLFCSSIPKSGTHLLTSMFSRLGYPTGPCRKVDGALQTLPDEILTPQGDDTYAFAHFRYDPDLAGRLVNAGYKLAVLIRDPRDITLSMADYLKAGLPKSVHRNEPRLRRMSRQDLLLDTIRGFNLPNYRSAPMRKVCAGWLDWTAKGAIILRYEDLAQSVVRNEPLGAWRSLGLCPHAMLTATRECFGHKSETLNRAIVNRWRFEFDDDLKTAWAEHAPMVAGSLGYPEV